MNEGTIEMRPTMKFRWLRVDLGPSCDGPRHDFRTTLQQQFINTATEQTEWRDVPVVEQP